MSVYESGNWVGLEIYCSQCQSQPTACDIVVGCEWPSYLSRLKPGGVSSKGTHQATWFRHIDPITREWKNVRASEDMGLFESSLIKYLESREWRKSEIEKVTAK